ncbi:MAG: RlmE family RNA methyltransferase [Oligoflexia bacterium]|nr:RlmE family RNA methyltransferase [Oligoflexia bacterium]
MSRKAGRHNKNTRRPGDHFYNAARDQGYAARSIFKLQEIQNKYGIFPAKSGRITPFYVLDLGCSPGSWMQFASNLLTEKDRIIGIDIAKININDPKVIFIQESVFNMDPAALLEHTGNRKFDLVLSDMAPKTSGIKLQDQQRSLDLCLEALNIASRVLRKNGSMLVKIFQGPDTATYFDDLKKLFKNVKRIKPESSRKESFEMYILATEFLSSDGDIQS